MIAGITYPGDGCANDGTAAPTDLGNVFEGVSLSLEGLIGVNFYPKTGENAPTINSVSFTVEGRAGTQTPTAGSDGSYTCYVAATEMANDITITVTYNDETDSSQTLTGKYSVQSYLNAYSNEKYHFSLEADDIIKAVGDYGYYTQEYLAATKSNWSALTDGKYTVGTGSSQSTVTKVTITPSTYSAYPTINAGFTIGEESSNTISSQSFALNLDQNTAVYLYVIPKDKNTAVTKENLTITNTSGIDNNITVSGVYTKDTGDNIDENIAEGEYLIATSGIKAAYLTESFMLNSTSPAFSYVIEPMYFAKYILENPSSVPAIASAEKNEAAAMYYYSTLYTAYNNAELSYNKAGVASAYHSGKYTEGFTFNGVTLPPNGSVVLYLTGGQEIDETLNFAFLDADGSIVQGGQFTNYTPGSGEIVEGQPRKQIYEKNGSSPVYLLGSVNGSAYTQIAFGSDNTNVIEIHASAYGDSDAYGEKRIYSLVNRTAN